VRLTLHRLTGFLCGAALVTAAAPAAAATTVAVRVEGTAGRLVARQSVTLRDARVAKDADPSHACPGRTAAGALEAATEGDWQATWAGPYGFVADAIREETATFALWIDHRRATGALCLTPLHAGDDVLLIAQPDGPTITPLGIRVPPTAHRRHTFTITVVDYTTTGRARAARGATVFANGARVGTTTTKGTVRVRGTRVGAVAFYASKRGTARSELRTTRIRR
jgi:hypothetical protein